MRRRDTVGVHPRRGAGVVMARARAPRRTAHVFDRARVRRGYRHRYLRHLLTASRLALSHRHRPAAAASTVVDVSALRSIACCAPAPASPISGRPWTKTTALITILYVPRGARVSAFSRFRSTRASMEHFVKLCCTTTKNTPTARASSHVRRPRLERRRRGRQRRRAMSAPTASRSPTPERTISRAGSTPWVTTNIFFVNQIRRRSGGAGQTNVCEQVVEARVGDGRASSERGKRHRRGRERRSSPEDVVSSCRATKRSDREDVRTACAARRRQRMVSTRASSSAARAWRPWFARRVRSPSFARRADAWRRVGKTYCRQTRGSEPASVGVQAWIRFLTRKGSMLIVVRFVGGAHVTAPPPASEGCIPRCAPSR